MGPKVKNQEIKCQVSTTFLESPQRGLTCGEKILVVAQKKKKNSIIVEAQ